MTVLTEYGSKTDYHVRNITSADDVNLGTGTKLRTGEVNPLFGFDGRGQQYDLIINGKNVGTFTNEG